MERRVWPQTAFIVVIGFVVAAWSGFIAGIETAPFFGDTPSRDSYISAGMMSLTAALAVLLLWVVGRLMGSGAGLFVLALPAVALVVMGVGSLVEPGDGRDPGHGRGLSLGDVFGQETILNWIVIAALSVAVAVLVRRRSRSAG